MLIDTLETSDNFATVDLNLAHSSLCRVDVNEIQLIRFNYMTTNFTPIKFRLNYQLVFGCCSHWNHRDANS
jgi:hypothetical protein